MKNNIALILLLTLFRSTITTPVSEPNSLVVSTTEDPVGKENTEENEKDVTVNPQIYSMEIRSNISNRFATTLITSRVRNLKKNAEETTFSVILPENAFISEFLMEIDGKVYKAYVKEKEEAKRIYQEAVSSGRSAAHVELSARDSKTFTVSVNIEPESKTVFKLTYEELLQRQIGQYELIVNIHPGQIVDNLDVEVYINESRPLTFVRTPSLRTGNEISKNEENLKPLADIDIIDKTSAVVKFSPDKEEQRNFADLLGNKKENGLAGQFVVQYDVERDPQGGEVLIRDGYFVHFFAPSELEPIPKHVVFVLDHSGSMMGRKIDQLTEAMKNILSDLNSDDLFHIIRFSEEASVWNITENKFSTISLNSEYGHLEPYLRETNFPNAVEVTPENINKAKEAIEDKGNLGLTNIIAGLEVGLFLIKKTHEKFPGKYQPMVIFLTDGQPNVGLHSGDAITELVTKLNSAAPVKASIFSLSFGYGADKDFLKKLSSKNLGFSKHIFEAADASLQLQDFYRKISSPLLTNVTFKYVDGVTDVTKTHHPFLFNGSELVICGKIYDNSREIVSDISGLGRKGIIRFKPIQEEPISSIERLWAYLTVKQLLKEKETATDSKDVSEKALKLALKYSFVTEVTSLVVVKPNKSESAESQPAQPQVSEGRRMFGAQRFALSGPSSNIYPKSVIRGYAPVTPYRGRMPTSAISGFSNSNAWSFPDADSGAPQIPMSFNSFHGAPGMPAPPRPYLPLTTRRPHYNLYKTTSSSTTFTPPSTTTTDANIPQWLLDLQINNQNVTTPQGVFLLGKSGDVTIYPTCPKTPSNEAGECKIIFDCPQIFPLLSDFNTYLQYFCPLNEYAGVCCPKASTP